MKIKTETIAVTLVVLLSLYLRVHGINYHSYGDEHFHVYNSLALASGQEPWNFHRIALFLFYGACYAAGWVGGIFSGPTEFIGTYFSRMHVFYYLGRLFESLVGTAAVLSLYLWGRKMFGSRTGLVAALFLAVSPVAVETSQIARGQALCLSLIIVSLWSAYEAIGGRRRGLLGLLAGLSFGAAFTIRSYAAIIILPLLYFHYRAAADKLRTSSGAAVSSAGKKAAAFLRCALIDRAAWSFLFGALLIFAVSSPYSFRHFQARVSSNLSLISSDADLGSVLLGTEKENSLGYYLREAIPDALSLPVYALGVVALIVGMVRFRKPYYPPLAISVALYVLIMGRGTIGAARYLFPILPLLYLLEADVLASGCGLIRVSERLRSWICIGVALLFAIVPIKLVAEANARQRQTSTKDLAQEWIFSNLPAGTRIAVERMGYTGPDLKLTPVLDYWIYNLGDEELRVLLRERISQGQPSFALKHFIEHPPWKKFYTTTISVREIVDPQKFIDAGYQYIVTCSSAQAIFEKEITRKKYSTHAAARDEYYAWLEKEGEAIKSFLPDKDTPGDEITVYRMKAR